MFAELLVLVQLCYSSISLSAFLKRFENGGTLVVAEGYIFEFERRGYLQAGTFVPEVILEHPELVKQLYEEYVHAGSDVVLALTEQVEQAVKHGADYIVGETFGEYGEARIALDAIKKYGGGVPAVITYTTPAGDTLFDGVPVVEGCKKLEEEGAAVVGLNCGRGPVTMLPLLKEIKKVCKCPVAALPVPYRTSEDNPTFFTLTVPGTDILAFPLDLSACHCSRREIADFARECKNIGIEYVGLCCGNSSHFLRIVAETYGKNPPASKYSPDMSKHYIFGEKRGDTDYYTSAYKQYITEKQS